MTTVASTKQERTQSGPQAILCCLDKARERLASILPPQAHKMVRALQQVDLAVQYLQIEGGTSRVLSDLRDALRALNQIERRDGLPPAISLVISTTIGDVVKAVRLAEACQTEPVVGSSGGVGSRNNPSQRRKNVGNRIHTIRPIDADEDTTNAFTLSEDETEPCSVLAEDTVDLPACGAEG